MAGPVLLLRFDEVLDAVRPADAMANLDDLVTEAGLAMPPVVDAVLGRGRRFTSADARGLRAADVAAGSTLLTRDASIRVAMTWDLAAQAAAAQNGTIYARGKGTGAAEYVGAGLELRVVNAALGIGELRWLWHDVAGALKTQVGGHFKPAASGIMILTATRRWVSSTEVVLRYFVGDVMLAEVISPDGSIGGGTTGTTSIGARFSGAWGRFLDGVIDELQVLDYELTPEEIAATWRRIAVHQPNGYQLFRELHDEGFPLPDDPGSRAQRETRQWGHGFGFAAAQAENIRDNIHPDRAYGSVLESWEAITAQPPRPGDSVDARRARVVARMRQRAGISIPGVEAALEELVATDPSNLELLAFDQTTHDDYGAATGLNELRWYYEPGAAWTIVANALRHLSATSIPFNNTQRLWETARMSIGGNGRGVHVLAKLTPTTLDNTTEVGIFVGDRASGNFVLMGYRNNASSYEIITEVFKLWVSQGVNVRGTLTGFVPAWLHLFAQDSTAPVGFGGFRKYTVAWAEAAESGPYTSVVDIDSGFQDTHWAGLYARTLAGAANIDVAFDDVKVRAPYGDRSFNLYVYRDPALLGRPDLVGGNLVLNGLKQAHTRAKLVTAKVALCDDENTGCDFTPMGAI